MSPAWLPLIVLALALAAVCVAVWVCDPLNAQRADLWLSPSRRRALREQELRDIDAWLSKMWPQRTPGPEEGGVS